MPSSSFNGGPEGIEAHSDGTASLFLFHTDSNVGYAIERSERLFYDVGLYLASGDPSRVHFAFRSIRGGQPRSLPPEFKNVFAYDYSDATSGNVATLAEYVRQNQIGLIVAYDLDVVHPLCRAVHKAGARAVIAFWGAPISSRMPLWKLTLKRLEVLLSGSRVDGLIFQSQPMADLAISGRGVPRHMIDVVRSGVDISLYKPARSNYVHDVLGFPTNRKVVVYSGHMEQRKGLESLVEAAIELLDRRKRQDVAFLMCGNKGDESKEYERLYAGLGLDEWIRFGGYRSDLPSIFPSCFCGVSPSVGWDSFPRSPVEMAACGLPVIAARLQGLSESVLDRQTGVLYEPGNVHQLTDCIETLLDDPELAAEYGRRGRERCEKELNREKNAERLRQVFLDRLRERGDR